MIVCRTVTSNVPDAETIYFIGVRERETGRKGTERERGRGDNILVVRNTPNVQLEALCPRTSR